MDYNKIIEENIGLVGKVINRYVNITMLYDIREDMQQVGMLALYKAIKRFDSSKGIKFSTYATKTIENDMKNFVSRDLSNYYDINAVSIESPITSDNEGESFSIEDTIGIEDDTSNVIVEEGLDRIERLYGERARLIINLRNNGYKYQEIANEIGLSKQRVNSIVKKIEKEFAF